MAGWTTYSGAYLDSVSEGEFDATFLALLKASGYTHVHLIHGSFEFDKDFIGRRDGTQFGLQTKAAASVSPRGERSDHRSKRSSGTTSLIPGSTRTPRGRRPCDHRYGR